VNGDENTDRFLLALGGFAGFGATFFVSLGAGGDDVSTALLKSAVGMLVGAIFVKLLISLAHSAFRDSVREKKITKKPQDENGQKKEPAPSAAQSVSSSSNQAPDEASAPPAAAKPAPSSAAASAPVRTRPIRPRRNAG
jgi:hypothetical protein